MFVNTIRDVIREEIRAEVAAQLAPLKDLLNSVKTDIKGLRSHDPEAEKR